MPTDEQLAKLPKVVLPRVSNGVAVGFVDRDDLL